MLAEPDSTDNDCYSEGTQYKKAALIQNNKAVVIDNVESPDDCQVECARVTGCEFWTWRDPTSRIRAKSCWLKRAKGRVGRKKNKISGPKTC